MIWPFQKTPQTFLGIDIGTSAIRVVELSKHGEQAKLENYGQLSIPIHSPLYFGKMYKGKLLFSTKRLAEMLKEVLAKSRIKSQEAFFAIPDFSTLFATFELPPMKREEIPEAVRFEARKRVPLPITEVTIDWLVIEGGLTEREKENVRVLLVVVPNRIIDRYIEIAELCGLKLGGMEAEVFSLQRALAQYESGVLCLIDIGMQSTTCNLIDNHILRSSHSFNIAGADFTERVSGGLGFEYEKAEAVKANQGILPGEYDLKTILLPILNSMLTEIKEMAGAFYSQSGKEVEKYIVAGSTAAMPGLQEYFEESLGRPVSAGFPFKGMVYPSILEERLKVIGPGFSIASGVALKGLQ